MYRPFLRAAPRLRPAQARIRLQSTSATPAPSGFSLKRNPMVPYIILLSLLSSAILKVLSRQQDMRVLEERTAARRSILLDVLDRLDAHERDVAAGRVPAYGSFDVAREIDRLTEKKDLDKTFDEIMQEIASAEDEWIDTTPQEQKPRPEAPLPPQETYSAPPSDASKPRSAKFL